MHHYLKYFLFHFWVLLNVAFLLLGGNWTIIGFIGAMNFIIVADIVFGDDKSTPELKYPNLLIYQVWLALPLMCLVTFVGMWMVVPGDHLGFGKFVVETTGYDIFAAKEATGLLSSFFAILIVGFMVGKIGSPPGHELVHRTHDKVSMLIGRWLLAFSFDSNFSIEHVYGHHVYVSTEKDPATAPRGRSIHKHILISILEGNKSAWLLEKERLRKKKLPLFSHHNIALRGYLMSFVLLILSYAIAGFGGLLFFIVTGFIGKSVLEMVNFIEHYGLVREEDTQVLPRHSWNSNKKFGSWVTFNLNRHSHHHSDGSIPYYNLKPLDKAPMMYNGYITCMSMALLLPPLWNKIMAKKLIDWDEKYASAGEQKLAHEANLKSGIKELVEYAKSKENKKEEDMECSDYLRRI